MQAKLSGLPADVRSTAVVLPNGEVMWARLDALAALHAIAATGSRIFGLDLRSGGSGNTPRPGIATEIPLVDCRSATSDDALRIALASLASVEVDYPEYPWVLVAWERS